MLKTSVRNSRPILSLVANLVLLNTAKSKLSIPSARSRGSTRCSFPKVKSAGAAKHAVLNHLETLGSFDPSASASATSRLANSNEPNVSRLFNTACFAGPADFTFGKEQRGDPRHVALWVWNFGFA